MTIASLPARCLDKGELTRLVQNLAARPDLWVDHVGRSSPERRHFASIHRDEYVDVWLICWAPGNDTGWHDHDISSGAVCVVRGALAESTPRIGGAHARELVGAGRSFSFGPDHIHRLTAAGGEEGEAEQSISLHAYSPPLWRLGQYTIDEDGIMRRMSVCYADELRPLDPSEYGPEPAAAGAGSGHAAR